MKHFNDKPSSQQPGYLFTNCLASFLVKATKKLLDRFKLGINIESVLSEFPWYTWHVRRLPCKDVPVLTDELDEHAFLFWIQIGADAELLGRIARHEVNKLSLVNQFEMQGWVMLSGGLLQRGHICRINIFLVKV